MSTRAVYMLLQYEHPQKLQVWELSQQLIVTVYRVCHALPSSEGHIAESQIKRATWSVQNNIAEGNSRRGLADRHRFFNVALSCLAEVDSMLGTIPVLYHIDQSILDSAEVLRRQITAGVLAMIKRGRK